MTITSKERIHAQIDMYLGQSFPEKLALEDSWVLMRDPFLCARLLPTGFETSGVPHFYLTFEGVLAEGLKDTPFLHRLITTMNVNYRYVKFTALPSGRKLNVYANIEIPADDLQRSEVVFAIYMMAGALDYVPKRIRRALDTKSLA